jgi:type I restriction enzyme S subunit
VFNEFLYYFLISQQGAFIDAGKGGAQPNISQTILKKWPIPLPPTNEQRRIVAKIEELFSELDKGVEALTTVREQLKAYRQSVLQRAFEGKLTERWRTNHRRAAGWSHVAMETIGRIETGNTPSTKERSYFGGNVPFFKPTDLDAGYQVRDARTYLSEAGACVARTFPADSILVTCIGATIGKTGLARVAGACNQQINFVVPAQDVHPAFMYFQIIGPSFQEQIKLSANSTTLPIINKRKFSQLPFAICPGEEQEHLVGIIEQQLSVTDGLQTEIDDGLNRIAALRQAILGQAFFGQLVAQDPKDEPASVLLQRIKAEREPANSEKKNGRKMKGKEKAA